MTAFLLLWTRSRPIGRRFSPRGKGLLLALATALFLVAAPASWAYESGSDGTDGALEVFAGQTRTINLADAIAGDWDTQIPTTDMGKGVYDDERWVVVFKYTTINIASTATVRFQNHPKGAPVVWLASGNVQISGTVDLKGASGTNAFAYSAGGPGGFAGGIRGGEFPQGAGSGPGGGRIEGCCGGSGGYGTLGAGGELGGRTYGSPLLLPLIGGSGGGGVRADWGGVGGGGGGGAILIAANGSITVAGSILADGGAGGNAQAGDGSGGAIRLVADTIGGTGQLRARSGDPANPAGVGFIRIENASGTQPQNLSGSPSISVGAQGPRFADELPNSRRIWISSIVGMTPLADPHGNFTHTEDVLISKVAGPATISIAASNNVPAGSLITVRLVPAFGDEVTEHVTMEGDFTVDVTLNIPEGRSVIQLRAEIEP